MKNEVVCVCVERKHMIKDISKIYITVYYNTVKLPVINQSNMTNAIMQNNLHIK